MINITIGNSYSKISGLLPKQEKELRELLSYTIGGSGAYFSGYGVRRKSLLSKRGEFPTGLYRRVQSYVKDLGFTKTDGRAAPATSGYLTPAEDSAYPWQVDAANLAVKAGRGTISACTGSGKSLVIALIASRLNVKTLVVVPTREIKKQLSETLLRVLNGNHKVDVENIDSAALRFLPKEPYDCLIIDEAHHAAAKTYQTLNKAAWAGIYYRFFLTATPFRNDTEETLLFEAIAGHVVYSLDYKTAVKHGYVVPVEAYYVDLPKQETDAFTYQEVYKDLVVNNAYRNDVLRDIVASLSSADKSVLCLVKEIAHGKKLYPSFVSGEDEDSRVLIDKFNSREVLGLVGTTGILGEGVDTRPCEYVVIAGLGKAKSQFMQQVGRAIRKYPGKESAKVIIFRDRSHKYLLRHFREQRKVLREEYGVEAVKLEL